MITTPLLRLGAKLLLGLVVLAPHLGCHRDSHAVAESQPATAPLTATAKPVPSHASKAAAPAQIALTRHSAPGRIVAIGDIHGDLAAARSAFRVGKLIDEADQWIGGNSVAVQTGDVLDRGDDERPLLEWLERLAVLAQQAGGTLYRINGNHEVMNVAGDFRYVTTQGFSSFADYANDAVAQPMRDAPQHQRGRFAAFLPGGPWARRLAQYPVVLIVNDTVFTHGGLLPKHVEYGLERINTEVSTWMRGVGRLSSVVAGDDAPFWVRVYGGDVSEADCAMLTQVLEALAVKRLVIGHTPQKLGMSFACNERVARIDVGLSSYYGNNPAAALEITANGAKVLVEKAPRHRPGRRQSEQAADMQP